jgi:hypothetical protein
VIGGQAAVGDAVLPRTAVETARSGDNRSVRCCLAVRLLRTGRDLRRVMPSRLPCWFGGSAGCERKLELADNVVNLLRHSLRRGSQIVFQGL